jgi:hypothetical protein
MEGTEDGECVPRVGQARRDEIERESTHTHKARTTLWYSLTSRGRPWLLTMMTPVVCRNGGGDVGAIRRRLWEWRGSQRRAEGRVRMEGFAPTTQPCGPNAASTTTEPVPSTPSTALKPGGCVGSAPVSFICRRPRSQHHQHHRDPT